MKNIRFAVSTDTHGVIYDHLYGDNTILPMGIARLSTFLKQSQQTHDLVYIDNGDALQGTPLLTYINKQNTKPHKLGEVFAHCGLQYYNLGNHDFNYGLDVLFNFMESMPGTCLTSNVFYKDKALGQSIVETINGVTFGFVGAVTDYIPNWEQPHHIKDVVFTDVVETVKKEVDRLRNSVDIIVVVYHGGIERDLETHELTERYTKENVGYQLAYLEGVDICFTGHQHRSINTQTTQALTLQSSNNAMEVMQVDVDVSSKECVGKLVTLEDYSMDLELIKLTKQLETQTQHWLDQPIGSLTQDLIIDDQKMARIHKHPLVSFINQVQLDATNAQCSATSLFNDAMGLNKTITMRDLVSTYVYPNTLVVKKMSGAQIKAMLERCANYFIINEHDEIDINPDYITPKAQHFNYDMIDGLEYTINVSNPNGEKIVSCTYNKIEIRDDQYFTVAMNNYRAVGGGDFDMVAQAPTVLDTSKDMVDLMAAYIEKHSPVKVHHSDNIHVIK